MFAGILQAIIAASARKKPEHTLDPRNHLVRPNPKATKHLLPNFIDRRNISCGPIPTLMQFPEVSSATET
jgi:hypothetical protein